MRRESEIDGQSIAMAMMGSELTLVFLHDPGFILIHNGNKKADTADDTVIFYNIFYMQLYIFVALSSS